MHFRAPVCVGSSRTQLGQLLADSNSIGRVAISARAYLRHARAPRTQTAGEVPKWNSLDVRHNLASRKRRRQRRRRWLGGSGEEGIQLNELMENGNSILGLGFARARHRGAIRFPAPMLKVRGRALAAQSIISSQLAGCHCLAVGGPSVRPRPSRALCADQLFCPRLAICLCAHPLPHTLVCAAHARLSAKTPAGREESATGAALGAEKSGALIS